MFFLLLVILSGCVSQGSGVKTGETAIDKEKEMIRLAEWYDVSRYNLKNEISGHKAFLNKQTEKEGKFLLEKSKIESDIRAKENEIENQLQEISGINTNLANMSIADEVVEERIAETEKKLVVLEKDNKKMSGKPTLFKGKKIDLSNPDNFKKISWEVTLRDDQDYYRGEFEDDTDETFEKEVAKLDSETKKRPELIEKKENLADKDVENVGSESVDKVNVKITDKKKTSYQDYTLAILDGWRNEEKAKGVGDFLTGIGCRVDRVGVTNIVYKKLINKVLAYCKNTKNNQAVALLKRGFSGHEVIVKNAFKGQKEDVVVVIGKNVP